MRASGCVVVEKHVFTALVLRDGILVGCSTNSVTLISWINHSFFFFLCCQSLFISGFLQKAGRVRLADINRKWEVGSGEARGWKDCYPNKRTNRHKVCFEKEIKASDSSWKITNILHQLSEALHPAQLCFSEGKNDFFPTFFLPADWRQLSIKLKVTLSSYEISFLMFYSPLLWENTAFSINSREGLL